MEQHHKVEKKKNNPSRSLYPCKSVPLATTAHGHRTRKLSGNLFSSLLHPRPSSFVLWPLLLFSTKKEEISSAALLEVGFGVQWTFFSALFLSISLMLMFLFVYRRLIALLVFMRRVV
jgi:hypothetical protein